MTQTTYAVGIDLGTTYTAAAVYRDANAAIFHLGSRGATIPSLVFLRDDQAILTGEAAERRGMVEPTRLAREFKRRVGDSAPIMLAQAPYSAERLMAALLKEVVSAVATREGAQPGHVAVSHPANWGPFKIDLLRHALDLAGLRSVTVLTEPVAAAVHYASKERVEPDSIVAVYDLGGGTFDAAVLKKTDTDFVTLGDPEGIERLGGIDFDEAVFAYVRNELHGKLEELDGSDPSVRVAIGRLRRECVGAKEALSADSETTIPVALPNVHTDIRLTRAEFEPMIQPALAETIEALRRAVERAGVRPDDLDSVLLVGGSSQIPLVSQMVSSAVGRPVAVDAHPKHSVALGDALVAATPAERVGARAHAAAAPVASLIHGSALAPGSGTGHGPGGTPGDDGGSGARTSGDGNRPVTSATSVGSRVVTREDPVPDPRTASTATSSPATPRGRSRRERARRSGRRGKARVLVAAAIGVGVAGAATVGAVALGSGAPRQTDPDSSDGNVVAAAPVPECPSASGRCARITAIALEGDRYVADYETDSFDPLIFVDGAQGTPEDHHVHFFFDTTAPENAGTNGNPPGQWTIWDRVEGGGELRFDGLAVADAGAASQLCVLVADAGHAVEANSGNCVTLPTPERSPGGRPARGSSGAAPAANEPATHPTTTHQTHPTTTTTSTVSTTTTTPQRPPTQENEAPLGEASQVP